MPANPHNPALSTRRVFPIGFSVEEIDGVQFLRFTWRPYAGRGTTYTEEIRIEAHDPMPAAVAGNLEAMARRITNRD